MNKHFEDAGYYLERATEHAKEGVREELEPVGERVRELTGQEPEPEPTRREKVQNSVRELRARGEYEYRKTLLEIRERVRRLRSKVLPR